MAPKKKKLPIPLLLLIILLCVTVVLCAAAAGVWYYGRHALTSNVTAPQLPASPAETVSEPEETPSREPESPVVLDSYTIEHNGKYYRYNDSMINLLLLGIDADDKPSQPLDPGSNIQCDVILLAAMDVRNNQLTLLSLNRDTICNLEVINPDGSSQGYYPAQLALSFCYGDGLAKSCELTKNTVSDLLYGLQIHGYGAFYMGGISILNDALGGVTVNIRDDYDFTRRFWQMIPGQDVTLTGEMAYAYIRSRQEDEAGNVNRMARQKQYMLAMLSQAMQQVKSNPASVFSLYDAVDDYILTDLDISRIAYLATEAASMGFDGEIRTLSGDLTVDDTDHMRLTLDQEALYETMLQVFYEEVTD